MTKSSRNLLTWVRTWDKLLNLRSSFRFFGHLPFQFIFEKRIVRFGSTSFFCVSAICADKLAMALVISRGTLIQRLIFAASKLVI